MLTGWRVSHTGAFSTSACFFFSHSSGASSPVIDLRDEDGSIVVKAIQYDSMSALLPSSHACLQGKTPSICGSSWAHWLLQGATATHPR